MGMHSQAGVGSLTSLGLGFPICNVDKVVGRIKHSRTGRAQAGASEVLHRPRHFQFPYLSLGIQALVLLHPQCEELFSVCLLFFFYRVLIFHLNTLEQDRRNSGVHGGRNRMVSSKQGFALIKHRQADMGNCQQRATELTPPNFARLASPKSQARPLPGKSCVSGSLKSLVWLSS